MTDAYDDAVIGIGGRGYFTEATLRKMKDAPRLVLQQSPRVEITLMIDGYDDDPRELWQIPEAVDYVRRYAKASGLHDWTGRLFRALHEHSKGLLIACDAIDKPHPFRIATE